MKHILATIAAGLLWGLISLFIKPLSAAGFSPQAILFFRVLISSLVLLVFILATDRSLLKIQLADLWIFAGTGIISLTLFSLCYFRTIIECGSSIAVILLYTSPVFVILFSAMLFKEKIDALKIAAILLTVTGCILVSGIFSQSQSMHISVKSFFIGLASGLCYALYSIFSNYALKKYNTLTVIFYTFVISTFAIMPFCGISSLKPLLSAKSSQLLAGIAVICTILPYFCYTFGLKGLKTGSAAILVTIEPIIGTMVGVLVFAEALSLPVVAGIVLILTSLYLTGRASKDGASSKA
ncbi:MAG: EamA family transporter [Spirochaetaceae bacterium]|nr:EamA family transporter [Spirochaetaceae bacterium]